MPRDRTSIAVEKILPDCRPAPLASKSFGSNKECNKFNSANGHKNFQV